MKTLNNAELEVVAGGMPFFALPALVAVIARPQPKPANDPVVTEGAE